MNTFLGLHLCADNTFNSSLITSSPPSHSLISNSSHLCWAWKKNDLFSEVDFGGAVSRAANSRSIFEISRPWRCEMWRFGISSGLLFSCERSFSDCSGGRIDAGGGASQGAGCERGTSSWPSPQPTSKTYILNNHWYHSVFLSWLTRPTDSWRRTFKIQIRRWRYNSGLKVTFSSWVQSSSNIVSIIMTLPCTARGELDQKRVTDWFDNECLESEVLSR